MTDERKAEIWIGERLSGRPRENEPGLPQEYSFILDGRLERRAFERVECLSLPFCEACSRPYGAALDVAEGIVETNFQGSITYIPGVAVGRETREGEIATPVKTRVFLPAVAGLMQLLPELVEKSRRERNRASHFIGEGI